MKKVYKYATGQTVPDGAIYLSTQVETETDHHGDSNGRTILSVIRNVYVWHYFLVEVEKQKSA